MVVVHVVAVVLFAVLVGVAVPAILQARRTLRTAEIFLERSGAKLDSALDEISGAAANIRAVAGHVEEGSAELQRFVATIGGLMDFLGSALASIRAWRSARRRPRQEGS